MDSEPVEGIPKDHTATTVTSGSPATRPSSQLSRRESIRTQTEPPSPSVPRKRTNEEIYRPGDQLESSPMAPRLRKSFSNPPSLFAASGLGEFGRPLTTANAPDTDPTTIVLRGGVATVVEENGAEGGPDRLRGASSGPPKGQEFHITDSISAGEIHKTRGSSGVTFEQQIADYQAVLNEEYADFAAGMEGRNRNANLDHLDWDELEARYTTEMATWNAEEDTLAEQMRLQMQGGAWHPLQTHFLIFQRATNEQEAERAFKRLRTRIALAQGAEEQLAEKEDHYAKVVGAFQTAMQLLGNPSR